MPRKRRNDKILKVLQPFGGITTMFLFFRKLTFASSKVTHGKDDYIIKDVHSLT